MDGAKAFERSPLEQALADAEASIDQGSAEISVTAALSSRPVLPDNGRRPTQKHRLTAWARGGRGIRQVDWMQRPAPDGGDPILRVAAIVGFLERDGFKFARRPLGAGQVEYILERDPASVARAEAAADRAAEPEQLALLVPPPISAIHGWDA